MNAAPRLAIAVTGALPLVLLVTFALRHEIPTLIDPCVQWGQGSSGSARLPGPPPCMDHVSAVSETRAHAIVRLTIVNGLLLTVSILGLSGAVRGRRGLCLAAAISLVLLTVPLILGLTGFVTLFSGLCFFGAWAMLRKDSAWRVLR
jgi:hypothetical protein